MSFYKRIEELIKYQGIKNVNVFAKDYLKYDSAEKIYRLKNENKLPSFEILQDISNKFENINIDWLVTGRGEMLRNSSKNEESCSICASKDEVIFTQNKLIKSQEEHIECLKKLLGEDARGVSAADVG